MIHKTIAAALSATVLLSACNSYGNSQPAASLPKNQLDSHWYADAEKVLQQAEQRRVNNQRGAAKNIILFLGDGMGISTVTAGRIFAGQQRGMTGEENLLSFEHLPYSGLIKTYNTNQQVPDSAGTMSAIMTGVKTRAGVLSVDQEVLRGDCTGSHGHELNSALKLAALDGKGTGVITTARVTHATPGATYANVAERDWEYTAPQGCADIASQFVAFQPGDGLDLLMGGGRRNFLPQNVTDEEGAPGKRVDGRNLVDEWKQRYANGPLHARYIEDEKGFDKLDTAHTDKLLALFNPSHMRYEADRKNDRAGEPSLSQMTAKGIELLQKKHGQQGYFLVVEGGRIDHASHAGNAYNALNETAEFSRAVQVAMDNTDARDTLIIVTADHSHSLTMAGYATRGNPILGYVVGNDEHGQPQKKPELAEDGKPYTTIHYANGKGYANLGDETDADARYDLPTRAGRIEHADVDTTEPGYHQEVLVPRDGETHSGEDVGIWARGPSADLLTGTHEQNLIFHVMVHAGGLLPE
ncbi:alkaline phosphatase [Microbulbifer sp. SAOS-129_SWC]|uniref:alkaline phosphatase n=1 Tax=Microbulbifer sp. SAOS-129_SWC TaxID=3145235 RepID=UPI003216C8C4